MPQVPSLESVMPSRKLLRLGVAFYRGKLAFVPGWARALLKSGTLCVDPGREASTSALIGIQ
ncbi:hypothetical protein F441_12212 [Phytophthora nicotianae CJ01A1]|uniref:Uncharacterized protein n=1 Tax=Phytophthora nicotianae CJ01A1 TaxID=1317063 RepID=W2WPH7_PHYNI|nr:hypothetical protein F441_12212 [Phytophthora nicotianae CJ01A1]